MNGSSFDDEMAISMILFLILLTIGFEKIKHGLEHGRSQSEKLVVNALFGEVTVLGFIALVTFFMIKSGMFEYVSMLVYHDDMHMLHLFEDVHFGLFFTMMLYLALVIWVLVVQAATRAKWVELEEQTRKFLREAGIGASSKSGKDGPAVPVAKKEVHVKPPTLPMPKDEYLEWRYNGGGRIPVGFDGVMHREDDTDMEVGEGLASRPESAELHQYMLLRARFLWGFSNGEGRKNSSVDQNFDFGRYLDNSLAETLTQIVVVHEVTWVAIAGFMVLAYVLFAKAGDVGSCVVLAVMGIGLACAMTWLLFITRKIQTQLSPPTTSSVRQVLTAHRGATPPYELLTPVKGLSKHEQLFPMGAGGPAFLQHFLRTTLLLAAIYMVGLTVVFMPIMFESGVQFLLPIALLCVFVTMALVRPILPRLTLITSVALLKRTKMVDQTLREIKLESSIKTIKILAALQSQLRRLKKMQGRERGQPPKVQNIDPKQKADLYEAFKLFDEDNSGSIDSKELFNLLRDLGQNVQQAEAERLILEMDTGDDGQVSFEEFCAVMADDDDAPVENAALVAHEMFKMLDKDNSGEITLREFREFLSQLPIDLTEDEVDSMLNDIFGNDDDAAINQHEFEHFLTQNQF